GYKRGSLGRMRLENLIDGGYEGALHLVNPSHRRILARRSHRSLRAIGAPVDLALIATPEAALEAVLADAARAGAKAAVILSEGPADPADAKRCRTSLLVRAYA